MREDTTLSPEEVQRLFTYDPETGELRWAVAKFGRQRHKPVGFLNGEGYLRVCLGPKRLYVHRIAFCWQSGRWPDQVDHINGNRSDNRWTNLREATAGQNRMNSKRYKNNECGFKGVHWHRKNKRWRARITRDGLNKDLGCFATREEAYAAYCEAAKRLHGEFARLE